MKTSNADSSNQSVHADAVAWNILQTFASTDMTLPTTEDHLQEHLGDKYDDKDWRPALTAVMDAKNDVQEALKSLQGLAPTHFSHQPSKIINDNLVCAPVTQLARAEEDLMVNMRELKQHNQIFGELPTIHELVNPCEENEDIDSPYKFNKTNDTEAEITEVQPQ
jgi:hypothetical protein